jgi:hypothetical protein
VAGCHSFCLFFHIFLTYIHSFNHIHTIHLSVAIRRGLSPSVRQARVPLSARHHWEVSHTELTSDEEMERDIKKKSSEGIIDVSNIKYIPWHSSSRKLKTWFCHICFPLCQTDQLRLAEYFISHTPTYSRGKIIGKTKL